MTLIATEACQCSCWTISKQLNNGVDTEKKREKKEKKKDNKNMKLITRAKEKTMKMEGTI